MKLASVCVLVSGLLVLTMGRAEQVLADDRDTAHDSATAATLECVQDKYVGAKALALKLSLHRPGAVAMVPVPCCRAD